MLFSQDSYIPLLFPDQFSTPPLFTTHPGFLSWLTLHQPLFVWSSVYWKFPSPYLNVWPQLSYLLIYTRIIQKVLSWTALHTQDNLYLTDFVSKYSSFFHTCTCQISKESSKYQYSYWHLNWSQSYTLAYIWRWKGGKRWTRRC